MVRLRIVHDDDVAVAQLRKQAVVEPFDKAIGVRGLEQRSLHDPTAEPDRTDSSQILPPIHRESLDELFAAFDPSVAARHRMVESSFVDEHQPVRGDAFDDSQEGRTFFDDVWPETLQRPAAFFLTT